MANAGVPMRPRASYGTDRAPPDFLLPRFKTVLNDQHFGTVDNINEAYTKTLKAVPKKDYRDDFYA